MNCKNCQKNLIDTSYFCANCGAKIVTSRLSTKSIWKNFIDEFFGWDNKFLFTIKSLTLQPEVVFKEYINGTRKKYVAPFVFLAIGTALAMLIFNSFSNNYIKISESINETQFEIIEEQWGEVKKTDEFNQQKTEQLKKSENIQKSILKYFNIFTFLLIPFYTLIAYLVFRKPYNYGEHLIITCYSQGFLFLVSILFFALSLVLNPIIYSFSILIAIVYYLYAYGRLYQLSAKKLVVKFLKFLGILLLFILTGVIIGILFVVIKKQIG